MDIGWCRLHCVYQSAVLIHPNMGFIAKVPCVALLDLMCIRIPLFLLVLGGRRRGNNGGIYDRSLFQDKALFSERGNNLCKQFLLQSILHQQVPKAANGISVRHLIAGINAAEI